MSNIETRVLSRLLLSFSLPDSADGENLSAIEVQTLVDVMHEFANVHPMLVRLFEGTAKIAHTLDKNPAYQLNEEEQKKVLAFWNCAEKAIAFQKGENMELDFVSLKGVEDITGVV